MPAVEGGSARTLTPLQRETPVCDRLVLATAGGAVPALLDELRGGATLVAVVEDSAFDSAVVRWDGPLAALMPLRLMSWCGVVLLDELPRDVDSAFDGVASRIAESSDRGVLGLLQDHARPLHFRIDPLGRNRWRLRDQLVETLGWVNAPSDWDVNITRHGGRLVAQIGALFRPQRLGSLARIPASTNPVVAAYMARRLEHGVRDTVLDPFCGAGTVLVEVAALARPQSMVASDIDRRALRAARANLAGIGVPLLRADASALPFPRGAFTRVVCNLPFGKRIGAHAGNVRLYRSFAAELARVLAPSGRAVLLTEEKRLLRDALRVRGGLHIVDETVLETGGLHPSVFVAAAPGS